MPPPPMKVQFLKRLKELEDYKKQKGDCNIPNKFPQNQGLSDWARNQRQKHPRVVGKETVILEFKTENTIMIGDTYGDMIAGNKAGVPAIGVLTGYNNRKKLEPYANHIIDDLSQLVPLISTL